MKKLLLLLLLIPNMVFAQNGAEKKHFQLGFGYSLGFFNPSDVNDYINLRLDMQNATMQEGTPSMFLNIGGRIFAGYKTSFNLGFEAFLEGALGPKVITVINGSNMSFMFNRFSPGVKVTYDIELGRKSSLILGAGIMHNRLKFIDDDDVIAKAASLGGKFSVAYQLNLRHIAPRAFIDIDIAKAHDNSIEMNYSGVQLGLAFSGIW